MKEIGKEKRKIKGKKNAEKRNKQTKIARIKTS